MNLDRVVFGLSLRSWVALLTFLSAAGVVYGYVQLLLGGSAFLVSLGLLAGTVGILLGASPPADVREGRSISTAEMTTRRSGGEG